MQRDNRWLLLEPREKARSRAVWQQFISSRLSRLRAIPPRPLPRESDRFMVYVATKRSPGMEFVLRQAISQLDERWGLQVLAKPGITPWISTLMKNWPGAHVDVLTEPPGAQYESELIRCEAFWRRIRGRYQLFLDDDSIVCHPGVDEFLRYDYVGALWDEHHVSPWCRYGSGGMSIRNKASMMRVCRECNTNPWMIGPEDVFFSVTMRLEAGKYRLPPDEVARRFAVEQVFHPEPFGLHRAWAYLDAEKLRAILDRVELRT